MAAVSKAQQQLAGADLRRKRQGKKTRTGMTERQLKDYAATPRKGLPKRVRSRRAQQARMLKKLKGG